MSNETFKNKSEWHLIHEELYLSNLISRTYRMVVSGGWIYEKVRFGDQEVSSCMVFVPENSTNSIFEM